MISGRFTKQIIIFTFGRKHLEMSYGTNCRWKTTFLKYFPRRLIKFIPELRANFVAVDTGLKLSYLFDRFQTSSLMLTKWLESLIKEKLISPHMFLLNLDDMLFTVNGNQVQELLLSLSEPDVCFINISKDLGKPRKLDFECSDISRVRATFKELLTSLTKRTESGLCSMLNLPEDVNKTSIIGLLLSFPVVYWFQGEDICLASLELMNIKFFVSNPITKKCDEIYSFTYPLCLAHTLQVIIEKWSDRISTKAKMLQFGFERSCDVITLPVIAF